MKVVFVYSLLGLASCGGSPATSTGFAIVPAAGSSSLAAVAGDALALTVVETFSDDSQQPLADGTTATFTAPAAITPLAADSSADSPIPALGASPTAIFIDNTMRPDRPSDLGGVLFVIDAGTAAGGSVTIGATIRGADAGSASATLPVVAPPAGDATRGATTYAGACARCHGDAAQGTPANPDGTTFTIAGMSYPYPAPGLDTAAGDLASDPDWNAALLAMAARADLDNGGLVLRAPMPDWWTTPPTTGGAILATQDYADIYAFLKTK